MKRVLMKIFKILLVIGGSLIAVVVGLCIFIHFSDNGKILLPIKHEVIFTKESLANYPRQLAVEGNKIIDEDGEVILFKGVNIKTPGSLHNSNDFQRALFEDIAATGANVVRVPVSPEDWVQDEDYLWRYLDPAVKWAGELGLYIIIDLHFIGNVVTGEGDEMPDVQEPLAVTNEFWKQIGTHFIDVPHVLFEIYNEPAKIDEKAWSACAQDIVNVLRSTGAKQVALVSGISYSKDLSWVLEKPIQGDNIAYACHIYPAHKESNWDKWFGQVSEQYPVVMTEWGFIDEHREMTKQWFLVGDQKSYGEPLLEYLKEREIGWVAWCYDDEWEPQMLRKDTMDYTRFGEFALSEIGVVTKVELKAKKDIYPVGTTKVVCQWRNHLKNPIMYGEEFYLFKLVEGSWEEVKRDERLVVFKDIGYFLEGESEIEMQYHLTSYSSGLDKGAYRISTRVSVEKKTQVEYKEGKSPNYIVHAYFSVE